VNASNSGRTDNGTLGFGCRCRPLWHTLKRLFRHLQGILQKSALY
jgi:hypothetical protein